MFYCSLLILVALVGLTTADGGERRFKLINLNCDVSEVKLDVYGYDLRNSSSEFKIFQFFDSRGSQRYDEATNLLPPTALDPSATNGGNTFYFPRDYFGNLRPYFTYEIAGSNDRRRVNILDNQAQFGESVYIQCDYGEGGVVTRVQAVSVSSYTIVGFEDTKAYAINDFSCTGGIDVFGASGRYYGADYPGISSILVPEWDYPIQVCKADRPQLSDCKAVLRPEGQGRNVYCLGSDNWWLTADYTYSCLNNCDEGKFDRNYQMDLRNTIQSSSYQSPRERSCVHADDGDSRVKMIECTQFESSQELIFNCDSEGCILQNRLNGHVIAVDDNLQVVWSPLDLTYYQPQRWIIHRDNEQVVFGSLQHDGKCLSFRSSERVLRLADCNENFSFTVDISVLPATVTSDSSLPNPTVTFFYGSGGSRVRDYSYGQELQFIENIRTEGLIRDGDEITTVRYCGGTLYIYDEGLQNFIYQSPSTSNDNRFATPRCVYAYLSPEQRSAVYSYVFIPLEFSPGSFPSISPDTRVAFYDGNGGVTEYNAPNQQYEQIPTHLITSTVLVSFCGPANSLLIFIGEISREIRIGRVAGCESVDARLLRLGTGSVFSYR